MSNAPKVHIADLIKRAEILNQDLEQFSKREINFLNEKQETYPTRSSEVLAAIIGGGLGLVLGFALSAVGGISTIITGPFGAIMGVAAAKLLWRGQELLYIDRAIKKYEIISSRILRVIKKLPEDTPEDIRQQQWKMYYDITTDFEGILRKSIAETWLKNERNKE